MGGAGFIRDANGVRDRNMHQLTHGDGREVIFAAGGILWRKADGTDELLLVRRRRYGPEWSLPKGKLDPGEAWSAAALREVLEETGYAATLGGFAGGQVYPVGGRPKVVLYWHMRAASQSGKPDPDEIVDLRWAPLATALELLTHGSERRLLAEAPPRDIEL